MKHDCEEVNKQQKPRPTEAEDIVSVEPKPWDDTGKHQEIHQHTQD